MVLKQQQCLASPFSGVQVSGMGGGCLWVPPSCHCLCSKKQHPRQPMPSLWRSLWRSAICGSALLSSSHRADLPIADLWRGRALLLQRSDLWGSALQLGSHQGNQQELISMEGELSSVDISHQRFCLTAQFELSNCRRKPSPRADFDRWAALLLWEQLSQQALPTRADLCGGIALLLQRSAFWRPDPDPFLPPLQGRVCQHFICLRQEGAFHQLSLCDQYNRDARTFVIILPAVDSPQVPLN